AISEPLLLLVALFEPAGPFFERFSILGGPGGFRQKKLQNLDTIVLRATGVAGLR
ncbi:MAG: hypothetical protein ICV56_03770, partial [Nitrososphaeraceae archaeon]|nr:hypothetical protein [Nitrososphaeraceae archaeon]